MNPRQHWPVVQLADLVEIHHGFAFSGQFFRSEQPGDVLVTPGNFRVGGGFLHATPKYYVGPVPEAFVLNEGDLIVTMTDLSREAATLGYPALVPTADGFATFITSESALSEFVIEHYSTSVICTTLSVLSSIAVRC